MNDKTGYKDRAAKDICLGDIVQYRLPGKGLSPKHGGATMYRIARPYKKIRLIPVDQDPDTCTGIELTERVPEALVIIDSAH